jgi:xanthine dehydrogenase YagT iron-sulfur-binding subunit
MATTISPLAVGCEAPDIAPVAGDTTRLAEYRGSPVVLIVESCHWDPARDEITARLASFYEAPEGVRVLRATSNAVPVGFGTGCHDAAFVIDSTGVIRWRYVAGIDALPLVYENGTSQPTTDSAAFDDQRSEWSRRGFVQTAITFAAALILTRLAPPAEAFAETITPQRSSPVRAITLRVNGRELPLDVEPRVTLLDALRNYAGLTGTKKGCDHGQCGACTVHIDGRRELSCMTFAIMQEGREITTIEGIAHGDALDPMQQAFIAHDGFQCGYCTSGQIMSATAVVKEPWGPTDSDVREAMSGNICRCGAYPGIVAAVQFVRNGASGGPR